MGCAGREVACLLGQLEIQIPESMWALYEAGRTGVEGGALAGMRVTVVLKLLVGLTPSIPTPWVADEPGLCGTKGARRGATPPPGPHLLGAGHPLARPSTGYPSYTHSLTHRGLDPGLSQVPGISQLQAGPPTPAFGQI